ncbi:MAG: hypothetical protein L0Y44_02595 [Phycisphaerales bacterium]|nr:hypothetical protein [Phycisphaerales bacterium]MCI0629525.1 hypothetical protein [Phycisphaerales bacterium]MCI0674275.1 hypothetical protein [Phycisphaerales bacterium]
MSWEDRDYAGDERRRQFGRPGGDWQGIRPTIDNPFTWALTVGRVGGITIRVHILFFIFVAIQILRALAPPPVNTVQPPYYFELILATMAGLWLIVLAHEFGHCLACRWVGGEADEILMWPLGGLAYCRPRHDWKAHLVTVLGGPLVNVVLLVVMGGMLWTLTGIFWGVALPNPLTLAGLWHYQVGRSFPNQLLFMLQATNLIMLLFNLMPVFPFDGGRIMQSLLWPRFGYSRSMVFAVRAGYIGAIAMGIFGAVMNEWSIVGVAIFGGVTCYITQKQLQYTDSVMMESDEYAMSVHGGGEASETPARPTRRQKAAQRQAAREQEEAREVDRILEKIAASGIGSLSRAERLLLKRATDRKRHQG